MHQHSSCTRPAMKTVHYRLSAYISHRTAGQAYIRALRLAGVPLADRPEDADVVILHDDPLNYPIILKNNPVMREKKLVAYSVWETQTLPERYLAPLALVDAIWTCSPFSRTAFHAAFDNVSLVPHIVERQKTSPEDLALVAGKLGRRADAFYFYTITDSVNPRKNLRGLLEVFLKNFLHDPDVFLVVKQHRHALDLSGLKNVIALNEIFTPSRMAALHQLCHCYASMHHCEAWGLPMSEALAVGNPVVATGYSGNMTYMSPDNSFPAGFTLAPVSEDMCRLIPLFTPAMRWADPDPGHFGHLMRTVRAMGGYDAATRRRVADSMLPYRAASIADILVERLR
ncbi:glycosyltransferase [Desulfolutivibrio sulfoxidireducens]|nr:glycosyltransferase [Desulfolutivibrio sulfoxidireducens]